MTTHTYPAEPYATMPVAEHLFDEELRLTGVTDYGASMEDLLSGAVPVPPQGARLDIAYAGDLVGERLRGSIKGLDFAELRADGRFILNIHATITTHDGARIALSAGGVMLPDAGAGVGELRLNMAFCTASPAYAWMNTLQAWGTGRVDLATGEIRVRVYEA